MRLACYRRLGRYNLCHNTTEACLSVNLPEDAPVRSISAVVEPNSQWDCDTDDPIEMARAILAYSEHCIYCSSLTEVREALAWIEERETALRIGTAEYEVQTLTAKLADAQLTLNSILARATKEASADKPGVGE